MGRKVLSSCKLVKMCESFAFLLTLCAWNDKVTWKISCHTEALAKVSILLYWLICCHTERSEVSKKLECVSNFFGFFAFCESSKWQKWIFDLICALWVDENVWEFRLLQKLKTTMRSFCFVLVTHFVAVTPCFCKGQRQKRRVNSHFKSLFCGEIYESLTKP